MSSYSFNLTFFITKVLLSSIQIVAPFSTPNSTHSSKPFQSDVHPRFLSKVDQQLFHIAKSKWHDSVLRPYLRSNQQSILFLLFQLITLSLESTLSL